MKPEALNATTINWFQEEGWTVFEFQKQAWQAWHKHESGLIHSPTGSGKTLAAWLGPVQAACQQETPPTGLQLLWITPLRALAGDTQHNLQKACDALGLKAKVETRTGDTASSVRIKQREKPPFALVTTPESLSLLLTYKDSKRTLGKVHTIVVDEWHELIGSKRGVQLELCIAQLRLMNPELRIWGLSATIGNLDTAMQTLLGPNTKGRLIAGKQHRHIEINTLLPRNTQHFPWSGHLGLSLLKPVIKVIENAQSTLLFTNTRSQAEIWFQHLLDAKPEWLFSMALHHGSIDRTLRADIEDRLRDGRLNCVVCTSSLDLGVDFSPVDQVIQIGSPKGVARLMQRAGRSGHSPGLSSRILCVPTHAFELVEIAAAKRALEAGQIEDRTPLTLCLDVLCQHLVSIATGVGFNADEMRLCIRNTHTFQHISDEQWNWVLDFITRGGQALQGYPEYHKVVKVAGTYRVMNEQIKRKHRMSIGTISSDATMFVAFKGGRKLGTIEEGFISRLRNGDVFQFSGRQLELIMTRDMTAYVKVTSRKSRWIPRWQGTHLPLSTQLSDSVLATLQDWKLGQTNAAEIKAIDSLLKAQDSWSHLPLPNDFLIETTTTHEGHSLFCFPFAGRLVNQGLGMLIAFRISKSISASLLITANDYGFELQCPDEQGFEELDLSEASLKTIFGTENLLEDILEAINASEITRRQFRDIARISGLIFEGYPGRTKSSRQVQASSSLIYDVLEKHDNTNKLLSQAKHEVLTAQLEFTRLKNTLTRLADSRWIINATERLSPLAFPLWAETLQSQQVSISSESFQKRVERMLAQLEAAAEKTAGQKLKN